MNTTTTVTVNTANETAAKATRGPGRPEAVLKYPRGSFTFKELYELNRGEKGRGKRAKVCELTVRNHIAERLADGFLTKIGIVETGKPGQPAHRYIRTAVKAAADAARAARAASAQNTPPAETPEASLVEVPVDEVAEVIPTPEHSVVSTDPAADPTAV